MPQNKSVEEEAKELMLSTPFQGINIRLTPEDWEELYKRVATLLQHEHQTSDVSKHCEAIAQKIHHHLQKAREEERERIFDAIDDFFIGPNIILDGGVLKGYIREAIHSELDQDKK